MNDSKRQALATLTEWKSKTLQEQSLEQYVDGLQFRFFSVTGKHLSDDPVQIVQAVNELLETIKKFKGE